MDMIPCYNIYFKSLFWLLPKLVLYGEYHHYTTGYTPLYIAEACYKYNYRSIDSIFYKFVNESVKI